MTGDRRIWLWFVPVLVVLGGVFAVPVADVIRFSFSDATLLRPVTGYGLDGYASAYGDSSLPVILRNTGLFTLLSVVSLQAVGLAIALLLVRGDRRGLWGMGALRTIVLAAWVIPGIANGLIWQMLLSEAPFGAVNSLLRLIGLAPVAWLSDPDNAMLSAVIANVWQGSAFSMIVFYAARRAVDPALYEAASVDGASPTAQFLFITIPQMRGAILVNTILALTGGGPGRATEVLSLNIFNRVFYSYDLGGGSALAVLLLAISMILTLAYLAVLMRRGAR
jgi:multiple sugar transport system permease protein